MSSVAKLYVFHYPNNIRQSTDRTNEDISRCMYNIPNLSLE